MRRIAAALLGLALGTSLGGCGAALGRRSVGAQAGLAPAGTDNAPPSATLPPLPSLAEADPRLEFVRAWLTTVPGRADATIDRIEWSSALTWVDPGQGPRVHVVAHDDDLTVDAWVTPGIDQLAATYWRMAEVLAAVSRGAVDTLVRGNDWSLWTIAGVRMLCPTTAGECFALPGAGTVLSFSFPLSSERASRRGTLLLATDAGRTEDWEIAAGPRGLRRRLRQSWLTSVPAFLPARDTDRRRARDPWEVLPLQSRPAAVVDDPVLAEGDDPALAEAEPIYIDTIEATEEADDLTPASTCWPVVETLRTSGVTVRVISCFRTVFFTGQTYPVAVVLESTAGRWQTPLFDAPWGTLRPSRIVPLGALAPHVVGFAATSDDDLGMSSEDLWVLSPAGDEIRLHNLPMKAEYSELIAVQPPTRPHEREWSIVHSQFVIDGPGRAHFSACDHWDGVLALASGAWSGEHRVENVQIDVIFDSLAGFAASDAEMAEYRQHCEPRILRAEDLPDDTSVETEAIPSR